MPNAKNKTTRTTKMVTPESEKAFRKKHTCEIPMLDEDYDYDCTSIEHDVAMRALCASGYSRYSAEQRLYDM